MVMPGGIYDEWSSIEQQLNDERDREGNMEEGRAHINHRTSFEMKFLHSETRNPPPHLNPFATFKHNHNQNNYIKN